MNMYNDPFCSFHKYLSVALKINSYFEFSSSKHFIFFIFFFSVDTIEKRGVLYSKLKMNSLLLFSASSLRSFSISYRWEVMFLRGLASVSLRRNRLVKCLSKDS